ncbi:ABC transporter ATP-binding protein [Paenibacillus sp. MMS18-CY102]|uniref:ABC transporter ATP-binding protein n=1 Tax=Paenibacillus sp. MMS18-CY102 TaxID=2682849 RepID=UPI0013658959|nr:ABC transporter ATP-binding protein [Paenibacillus sp. MMS18-CY102]MWC26787.1 ATP-binding cassette domain-containing protein [Paenibacillus sp. MMS18-CY102]
MIRVEGISKTFGQGGAATRALKQVSFGIAKGETIAVTGPSGCGKTTLLHILAGIESLDEGEIWIGDTALHKLNEKDRSQLRLERMGFVFQSYHLVPVLTAWENIALPLIARGVRQSEAKRKALDALDRVGLPDKRNRYPAELSGGQNQRVAIARAIVGKPDMIWADEPTGALDSETAKQIVGLLDMLNKHDGTTIVTVTHDPDVAAQSGRTIKMASGRIIHDGVFAGC